MRVCGDLTRKSKGAQLVGERSFSGWVKLESAMASGGSGLDQERLRPPVGDSRRRVSGGRSLEPRTGAPIAIKSPRCYGATGGVRLKSVVQPETQQLERQLVLR